MSRVVMSTLPKRIATFGMICAATLAVSACQTLGSTANTAASAPAAASCGDLRGILADKPKKKLRKSVSFHSTVSLVRSESLSDLPADEKHRIWYRSDDYSRFVHSELGRRREMGVTSTSLIMPTRVAHFEVEDDYASDGDARMDDWRVGCDSDSYSDSDEGSGGDAPVRVVG